MNTFNSSRLHFLLCIAFSISLILVNFSSCSSPVPGCTDPEAISFDLNAEEDDGSCMYFRDQFLGRYNGTFDDNKDYFKHETTTLRIVPKPNTKSTVLVFMIGSGSDGAEGTVSEGQIYIDFVSEGQTLSYCSPLGLHADPGSLHLVARLIFGPDNNTVTVTSATFRSTYDDFDCTISYDAEYTRI